MDQKTIEAMNALGVDITPDAPIKVPTPEEAAAEAERLLAEKNGVEAGDKPSEDKLEENKLEENKSEESEVVTPEETPDVNKIIEENKEPEILNDKNPELDSNKPEESDVDLEKEDIDLDEVLKTLEEMSKESLDDATEEQSETEAKIKEKIKQANAEEGDPKKQSKTLQEIVDLNVKLQQDVAFQKAANEARIKKLQEVTEELNQLKLDDTKEVVPDELKGVNKYLKKFRETSSDTFKIKAIQEAIDVIENLTGKPLKGSYVDDFIEDELKSIEAITKKQANEVAHKKEEDADPRLAWAKVHGVGI